MLMPASRHQRGDGPVGTKPLYRFHQATRSAARQLHPLKALRLTPDIQLCFDPDLRSSIGPAAVFTIRTTAFF